MNTFHSIVLNKNGGIPLYQQLAEGLCRQIEEGTLLPNSKLPPIRTMASQLKVNAVTVVNAYKYLEQKKVVYSQVGSGTYVSPIPVNELPVPVAEEHLLAYEGRFDLENAINFVNTALPHELFPTEEFKEAFDHVLDREKGGAFAYQDSMGHLPLREILCTYLEEEGIKTTPQNIQILSGGQQGLDVVSKAMMTYGDIIFVEKPTFYGAAGAFLSRGGKLVEIPMEADGMDMTDLENLMKLYHPRFIYMMAYFQTPTGISYSMDKKRKLLELAERYDTYIIEDNNLYDFNYSKTPVVPLKALDYKNRVIYIKSFSKILMPGLRIGFMVIPKKILHSVITAKYTTDISTSGFIQKALTYYLEKNGWQNHGDVMRKYGSEKYGSTIRAADRYLKGKVTYLRPEGGISLWLDLGKGFPTERLCSRLLEKNVILSPGSQFTLDGEESHHIRLCFANVSNDKIEVGIKRLGEGIAQLLEG